MWFAKLEAEVWLAGKMQGMCVLLGAPGPGEDFFFLDGKHHGELGLGTGSPQCLIPLGTYPRRLGLPSNEIQIHLIEHGS